MCAGVAGYRVCVCCLLQRKAGTWEPGPAVWHGARTGARIGRPQLSPMQRPSNQAFDCISLLPNTIYRHPVMLIH